MIDEFLPVLDTWYERIEEVETREAYRALFWDEIYSGISAAKYGIRATVCGTQGGGRAIDRRV